MEQLAKRAVNALELIALCQAITTRAAIQGVSLADEKTGARTDQCIEILSDQIETWTELDNGGGFQ